MTEPQQLTPEQRRLLQKATVMVVEDAEIMRSLMVNYLKDMGFANTVSAGNGRTALEYINSQPVQLIICDWDMPDMDGMALLAELRSENNTREIPFLMVTAVNDAQQVRKAISSGVNDYLTKPFKLEEFGYRVLKMLRKVTA